MKTGWMIRAGHGGYIISEFEQHKCVALGWHELGDLSKAKDKNDVRTLVDKEYSEHKIGRKQTSASQISRFLFEVKPGDRVITFDSSTREYLVGEIEGPYQFRPQTISEYPHTRRVKWIKRINRDDLSVESHNTLGSTLTLFAPASIVWDEVDRLLKGEKPIETENESKDKLEDLYFELQDKAHEFIKDKLNSLSWDDMQEIVAGILRAMGYKTMVSDPGSDRGKDIIASPDGLGLEQPRIRAEVKHRSKQQMGAPEIRSFIATCRNSDKGLYVSTGGFSKEAHYEAERAHVPIMLIDIDKLATLLIQHFEQLDIDTRAMIPLKRIYWPI